ncbi:MAG: adenylate/guanylate cyclase domain-containing protein [Rhizobiaceae bacterium]|nr:adenylate/guanylate cyclase domain-containing protein [Rhizobiaceae bacterium]
MTTLANKGLKRRLSAIIFADVVNYSRMMGEDEVETTVAVKQRVDAFEKLVGDYSGEIVSTAGDGVFMLFDSAVDAVGFALAIQKTISSLNENVPESKQIVFRFGVNIGDVLFGEKELTGESINIAARIESFASPGRICISGPVYDSIANKMTVGYEYLGAQKFKNIKDEVEVFQVHEDPTSAAMTAGGRRERNEQTSFKGDPIIDQSIVVLPFTFQGSDQGNSWFADGLTEDITTSLSRFQQFFVISRGSAYVYVDRQITPKEAANELGVRYVVNGSVRMAGTRIRITIQLVDVIRDRTIWGEQYNRNFDDLFDLQDEITQTIVSATAAKIETSEIERLRQLPPANMAAYGFVLQGQKYILSYTRDGVSRARSLYESALGSDPKYARAFAAKSRTLNLDWRYNWVADREKALDNALDLAQNAINIDTQDARGFGELGFSHLYRKEYEAAISAYERAQQLNPNDADLMSDMADALAHCGRSEEAIALLEKAMRLNPFYPDQYVWHLGGAYYNLKEYDKAIATIKTMQNPTEGRRILAASYGMLGKTDEAKQQAALIMKAHPNFNLDHWASILPDFHDQDTEHFIEGLRRAGL